MSTLTTKTYVEAVVAQAPPLTGEQRARLAELLRPVRHAKEVDSR